MPTLAGHILVVEDNKINRKVIDALLKKMNFSSDSVENGQEAVNAIIHDGKKYDIILMDVQMPIMDGFTATKNIREWEQTNHYPRLPILALTAGTFAEDRQHALDAGMDDFIPKPIDRDNLIAILSRWLS